MNAYDFDGTIYPGDCSVEFGLFCCMHHPKMWVTFFPKAITNLIKYKKRQHEESQNDERILQVFKERQT